LTKAPEEKALLATQKVPNADTRAAMEEARAMSHSRLSRQRLCLHAKENLGA